MHKLKLIVDAEKVVAVVTPPLAYQNSTPEKSKSAPETQTSKHNPTQNKAVSSTGAGIARSPSQTPNGTKTATVNRQSDSSIATVNMESVKTRAKGKQQLQDAQLSETNSLDLSTICRPSSIESMECHPPSPHHDRVSVTTADGYDTTPESVFTPDVGAGQQHTVTVKSTTASDLVKSPPLSTFAPLPAAADNSKALDHVIRNSSEDSGANAQPYPAKRKAEAMDVREKRPVHSHRHAIFYQPDDQGEEFTDVNLFAVKQQPKIISQEPAEQNEFDNSVGSTAVKCEENSAVQSEESTRNRAMSLADQREAKAAVCSEILTQAIDDIDCGKLKAPPRPVKRARKDSGTMFYDEQGKCDIDPMKLVRLIDRQPPSPNPVLAAEPNAKVSEKAGLGYEPAKNRADSEVPLCRRFEDVDEISEDVSLLIAAADIINKSMIEVGRGQTTVPTFTIKLVSLPIEKKQGLSLQIGQAMLAQNFDVQFFAKIMVIAANYMKRFKNPYVSDTIRQSKITILCIRNAGVSLIIGMVFHI